MSGLVSMSKKVPDEILKTIQCSLSMKQHISNDPVLLACGHIACRRCVVSHKNQEFTCFLCNKKHVIEHPESLVTVRAAEIIIESYIKELFSMSENDLRNTVDLFEGKIGCLILWQGYSVVVGTTWIFKTSTSNARAASIVVSLNVKSK